MFAFLMIASALLNANGANSNVYCSNGMYDGVSKVDECHIEFDDMNETVSETVITSAEALSGTVTLPTTTIHGKVPTASKNPMLVNCGAPRDIGGGQTVRSCDVR